MRLRSSARPEILFAIPAVQQAKCITQGREATTAGQPLASCPDSIWLQGISGYHQWHDGRGFHLGRLIGRKVNVATNRGVRNRFAYLPA